MDIWISRYGKEGLKMTASQSSGSPPFSMVTLRSVHPAVRGEDPEGGH